MIKRLRNLSLVATASLALVVSACGGGGGSGLETGGGAIPDNTQQALQAAIHRARNAEIAAFSSASQAVVQCEAVPAACMAASTAADQALLAEAAREEAEASTTVGRAERAAAAAELAASNAANAAAEAVRIAEGPTTQPPPPQTDVRWPDWIVQDVAAARNLQGGSILTEAGLNSALQYILSTEGGSQYGARTGVRFDPYHHEVTMNDQNQLAENALPIVGEPRGDCATPFAGSTCGVRMGSLSSDEFFGKSYQPIMVDRNGMIIGQGRSGFTYVIESRTDYERLSYWEASVHVFGLLANRYSGFGVGYFRDTGGFGRRYADETKPDETVWRAWSFTVNQDGLHLGDHDRDRDLSATYVGSMLGVTRTQDPAFVHGDATITVSNGGRNNRSGLDGSYNIDASFTNMVDSNGNTLTDLTLATVHADDLKDSDRGFGENTLPYGAFSSNLPAEGLEGSFLLNGASDEDIIGTFYHSRMIGSYGVTRQ